jgi:hypothetical protein
MLKFWFLVCWITVLLPPAQARAQCNDWEKLLGYEKVYVADVVTDRFGNVYAVGWFNSPDFVIDGTAVPLYGDFSAFIVKFNKDLSLQWARSVGNNSIDLAQAAHLDNEDNLIVSGYFFSTSVQFDCFALKRASRSEMFVVKYDHDGNVQWAKGSQGMEDGFWVDISVNTVNDIIVTTSFVSGSVSLGGKSVTGTGGYDSFIASVTESGDVSWMRSFGGIDGPMPDYITGVATDSDDNIVVTGFFESDFMVFDDILIPKRTISENFFIAKLTKEGVTRWAKGSARDTDNGGYDIAVDKNNNIFVTGRFFDGETAFDEIPLAGEGYADIFVVEYTPAGKVTRAKSFGGPLFDAGQKLAFDAAGNVVISGYFYSYDLWFDSFQLTKPEFQSDVFVVTLDRSFETICVNQVSGPAESLLSGIHIDKSNNIWLAVENSLGEDLTNFGATLNSRLRSAVAVIGHNSLFDVEPVGNFSFDVNLGADLLKCPDEVVMIDAGMFCDARYIWSDGSSDRYIQTSAPGTFWVEVEWHGSIARDTIIVQSFPGLDVDLGEDVELCPGSDVSFDVTQSQSATYAWSSGHQSATNTIGSEGLHWVKVVGRCETVYDSVSVHIRQALHVDLGPDTVLCVSDNYFIGGEIPGAQSYRWQDGSTAAVLQVIASGVYEQTVSNECGEAKDQISIKIVNPDSFIIPNVVTDDGNQKNDKFFIAEASEKPFSLLIFNRWGQSIFATDHYENNWPDRNLSSGVYFYSLKGDCLPKTHGFIQLIR